LREFLSQSRQSAAHTLLNKTTLAPFWICRPETEIALQGMPHTPARRLKPPIATIEIQLSAGLAVDASRLTAASFRRSRRTATARRDRSELGDGEV
jgi:hypothetical protein